MPSNLEATFALALKSVGVEMVQQYKFHPTRRWRMDFAHVETKTAAEVDGGEFMRNGGGSHNRGARMANDYEKRNSATEMGWAVFQLTGAMVRKDPVGWARRIGQVIEERKLTRNAC